MQKRNSVFLRELCHFLHTIYHFAAVFLRFFPLRHKEAENPYVLCPQSLCNLNHIRKQIHMCRKIVIYADFPNRRTDGGHADSVFCHLFFQAFYFVTVQLRDVFSVYSARLKIFYSKLVQVFKLLFHILRNLVRKPGYYKITVHFISFLSFPKFQNCF